MEPLSIKIDFVRFGIPGQITAWIWPGYTPWNVWGLTNICRGNPLGPRRGDKLLPWASQTRQELILCSPYQDNPLTNMISISGIPNTLSGWSFCGVCPAERYHCWDPLLQWHVCGLLAIDGDVSWNNIQNVDSNEAEDCGLFSTIDSRNQAVIRYQKAYIRKIATELNEYDNLIFDICDEPSLQGLPDGSIINLPDSIVVPWVNAMKEVFLQAEELLPKKHLLGQTVQNLSPDFSGESWCSWLPAEYVKPAEKALNLNYKNNKPIINVDRIIRL